MEFTGQLKQVQQDYNTGKYNLTFSMNESYLINQIEKIQNVEKLSIKAVRHTNKRSKDANAYAWVLMQKIAEAIHSDKWEVYLDMLQKYSREFTFVICKKQAVNALKELYRTCIDHGEITVNGNQGHQLQVFFGSSTFDTKSMAVFIDGIVSECKDLDIETLPPDEIERMKKQWQQS